MRNRTPGLGLFNTINKLPIVLFGSSSVSRSVIAPDQTKLSSEIDEEKNIAKIEFGPGGAFGTSLDCIKVIEEYVAVGVTHFVLHCLCYPSEMVSQY